MNRHLIIHIEDQKDDLEVLAEGLHLRVEDYLLRKHRDNCDISDFSTKRPAEGVIENHIRWSVGSRKHEVDYLFIEDTTISMKMPDFDDVTFVVDAMRTVQGSFGPKKLVDSLQAIEKLVDDVSAQARIFTAFAQPVKNELTQLLRNKHIQQAPEVISKGEMSKLYAFLMYRIGFS